MVLTPQPLRRELPSEDATLGFGRRAAAALPRLDRAFVLYLCGDLGAGKTTFSRGLLAGLGEAGPVRSPSYGLVADYTVGDHRVLHLDLYRLQDPEELSQLGLRDEDRPGSTWLVEWPGKGGSVLAPPDATLTFGIGVPAHTVEATAATPEGRAWLAGLFAQAGR